MTSFTPAELRKLRSLKNPYGIQRFLDDMPYHIANTSYSPAARTPRKHFALFRRSDARCAALRANGYPPLIFDLEAEQDTDHVVAIYRERGHWGAIAKSNFTGCRYREPVYRSLRELALSYFDGYFNLRRERTLRRFSVPVNLSRFDSRDWMTTEKPLWFIAGISFRCSPLCALLAGHREETASPRRPVVSGGLASEAHTRRPERSCNSTDPRVF